MLVYRAGAAASLTALEPARVMLLGGAVAGQGAIDVDGDPEIGSLGRKLIGRHHVIDERFDKSCLVEIEELISGDVRGAGSRLL